MSALSWGVKFRIDTGPLLMLRFLNHHVPIGSSRMPLADSTSRASKCERHSGVQVNGAIKILTLILCGTDADDTNAATDLS